MSNESAGEILRHIEHDMGQILHVLKRNLVFEVMVNPYLCEDGTYEGHIWYEEAGVGQKRLTSETEYDLSQYPIPKLGDKVIVKVFNNDILCWHVLPQDSTQQLAVISLVMKSMIKNQDGLFKIVQDDDYELSILSENIKSGKFQYAVAIESEVLSSLDLLLEKINQRIHAIDGDIVCTIECKTVTESNISHFSNVPSKLIALAYEKMTDAKARIIMGILAGASSQNFHEKDPTLECTIPFYHHRFTGIIPPCAPAPTMCIRKHTSQVITLDKMVENGIMPVACRETIRSWVKNHFNILIAGGVGSGKTTMANSILDEIRKETPQDRVGILEDTPELQCRVANHYKTYKTNERDMSSLLRTTLRMRPDRIVVGEIRGAEAYTLLKAWMSGHPGGVATIHASSAKNAIHRFEQCISESREAGVIPRDQIAYAVNGIISIQKVTIRVEKNGHVEYVVKRRVTGLRQIRGYDKRYDIYEDTVLYSDDSPFEQEEVKVQIDYLGLANKEPATSVQFSEFEPHQSIGNEPSPQAASSHVV